MKTVDETGFHIAIGEFNEGRYFEAHDLLETLWMEASGDEKRFLQGLIQIAVGCYHYFNGNPSGALSQWGKGSEKLQGCAPVHGGIDLAPFLRGIREWTEVAAGELSGKRMSTEGLSIPRLEFNHNSQRR